MITHGFRVSIDMEGYGVLVLYSLLIKRADFTSYVIVLVNWYIYGTYTKT